ncbi:MAG: hypothetical protein RMI94_04785 [Bryobacterales bacterium]|nr:hypothetical protein [Bryobacterales bacterium]
MVRIAREGRTVADAVGCPQAKLSIEPYRQPNHHGKLPAPLRVPTGHGGSHAFVTHEFIQAIVEDRHPEVNVREAVAYTVPGIVAHHSASRGGEPMKIPGHGIAPC